MKTVIPNVGWAIFSLSIMIFSYRLGIGRLNEPGPGLMPFLAALVLFAISGCFAGKSLWKLSSAKFSRTEEIEVKEDVSRHLGNISFVLACLFAYALLLRTLGFLVVTFLFLFLLFWRMGTKNWRSASLISLLTVFVTYFMFRYLGVFLPAGILDSVLW